VAHLAYRVNCPLSNRKQVNVIKALLFGADLHFGISAPQFLPKSEAALQPVPRLNWMALVQVGIAGGEATADATLNTPSISAGSSRNFKLPRNGTLAVSRQPFSRGTLRRARGTNDARRTKQDTEQPLRLQAVCISGWIRARLFAAQE
jgi:hypothetical protein